MRKCKFVRQPVQENPCTILSLLNTQVVGIKANARLAAYLTADGTVFVMGRDYRARSQPVSEDHDLAYGIPKQIDIGPTKIINLAMGQNHMLLLANTGNLYSLGSNNLGQLGVSNSMLSTYDEHPLTLDKLYYTASPVLISMFNSAAL